MATFSERLNIALENRKMKAADLARITGINEGAISQYRKGAYKAKQPALDKLAKALNVAIPWIMGVEEQPFDVIRPYGYKPPKHTPGKAVRIPILGRIVAGVPIEATEDILDYEEITEQQSKTGDYFALKVKGDSMTPQIADGDIVIVRKQDDIESGDTAIVLVNGNEATVKKVQKSAAGITLIGYNTSVYEPHFYCREEVMSLPVQVIGKVVEMRRKL